MISWLIVRAGLPVPAGALVITAVGFLLGIFAQDFFGAIFGLIGDFFNWIYHALPTSWIESEPQKQEDGSILVYATSFGWYFRDFIDFFRRPGSGLLIGLTVALYWIFELIVLAIVYRKSAVTAVRN